MLINGFQTKKFKPEHGLRQGDPLSPFYFVIFSKGLSTIIRREVMNQSLKGLSMGTTTPKITHLFFADDNLFFLEGTGAAAAKLKC